LIAGAAGGIAAVAFKPLFVSQYNHVSKFDCLTVCNGILQGLVTISASCDRIDPWAAFCIAIMGAIFYLAFCKFLEDFHLDDVSEGTAVHFIGGMWGLLATGYFDTEYGVFYRADWKNIYFSY